MKLFLIAKRFTKKLTAFDWLFILVVVAGLIFVAVTSLKKEGWINIEFKVTSSFYGGGLPSLVAQNLKTGDYSLNQNGQKNLEVIQVNSWGDQNKIVWVKAKTKVQINPKTHKYLFNYQPLEIGRSIDVTINGTRMIGIITWLENIADTRQKYLATVNARMVNNVNPYSVVTRGVDPWIAEAIKVGEQMRDTSQNIIAEVINKEIKPAERIIDVGANTYLGQDPLRKDVYLTLKIMVIKDGDKYYYLEDIPIKVDSYIPVILKSINISPVITDVVTIEPLQ